MNNQQFSFQTSGVASGPRGGARRAPGELPKDPSQENRRVAARSSPQLPPAGGETLATCPAKPDILEYLSLVVQRAGYTA